MIRAGARVKQAIVDAGVEVTRQSRSIDSGTPIPIYARTENNRGL